jgi:DNA-binding MurR/RpiR family transcriptional regulator
MKLSILERLALATRDQPPKQARVAQYVIDHAFEATTSPMRALAKNAGEIPATFTRLAQGMGFSGWDELRAELTADTRDGMLRAQQAPYSSRSVPGIGGTSLMAAMLRADAEEIAALQSASLSGAAVILEKAPRVMIAGFRSCHAPAALLHYLYRLFRPDVSLVGSAGALDLELGSLRSDDAVVVFGFQPYSRDSLLTARAAAQAKCKVVAIVDSADAPIASDAAAVLTFGVNSPSFFPSLTACVALVQGLAGLLYARSGEEGRKVLQETERRIEAHTAYLSVDGGSD